MYQTRYINSCLTKSVVELYVIFLFFHVVQYPFKNAYFPKNYSVFQTPATWRPWHYDIGVKALLIGFGM
jgi:hypothetical protein